MSPRWRSQQLFDQKKKTRRVVKNKKKNKKKAKTCLDKLLNE